MKTRKWILYAAAGVLVAGLAAWFAKKQFRVDALFRAYLIEEIFHATRQQVTIAATSLEPGHLKIRGVSMRLPETREEISIGELDITYSLASLVRGGFQIRRAMDRIVVQRPELRLAPAADSSLAMRIRRAWQQAPGKGLEAWPSSRLIVSEGALYLADTTGTFRPVCTAIRGFGDFKGTSRNTLQLSAICLPRPGRSAPNLTVRGAMNPVLHTYQVTMTVDSAHLEPSLPLDAFLKPVHSMDALVDVDLTFQRADDKGQTASTGQIDLQADVIHLMNSAVPVRQALCQGTFDANGLVFQASANYAHTRFNGHGVCGYGTPAKVSAQFVLDDVNRELIGVARPAWREKLILGHNRTTVIVRGTLADPEVSGSFTVDQPAFGPYGFTGGQGQFTYSDSLLSFIAEATQPGVRTATSRGTVRWQARRQWVALEAQLRENDLSQPLQRLVPVTIGGAGDLQLALSGPTDSLVVSGSFSLQKFRLGAFFTTDQMEGSYGYRHGALTFASQTPKRNYHVEGQVSVSQDTLDLYGKVRINALLLDTLAHDCGLHIRPLPGQINAVLEFMGRGTRYTIKARGGLEGNPLVAGSLVADGTLALADNQAAVTVTLNAADLRVRRRPLPVSAVLDIRNNTLAMSQLSVGELVENGSCTVRLTGERSLEGRISLSQVPAADLAALCTAGGETLVIAGTVNGTVRLAGTLAAPTAIAEFSLLDGTIRSVANVSALVSMTISPERLALTSGKLYRGKRQLAEGSGEYVFGRTVTGTLKGENLPVGDILGLVQGEPLDLTGSLAYQYTLQGTPQSPAIQGTLSIANGKIAAIPFTRLQADVVWMQDVLEVKSFKLAYGQDYSLEGYGTLSPRVLGLSHAANAPTSHLVINASGNLFRLVPATFFEKAFCYGKAALQIGEQDGRLVLNDFSMLLSNGEIKFAAYPVPVADLNGSFRFDQGRRLVKIERMYGTVDGNRFSVDNRDEVVLPDKILVPLTIGKLDLKLGVFSISMAKRMAPLYVPGLLAKGQRAALVVGGRRTNEPFYIAGPNANPTVRGELEVTDADFTYPFILDKKSKANFSLLKKINWDLRVVAGKNVRYYSSKSEFGNLELDENGEIDVQGSLDRRDFYIEGKLTSSDGQLSYLGEDFDVREVGVEFDRFNRFPVIYGEAEKVKEFGTAARTLLLKIFNVDELTGKKNYRPRWDKFKLNVVTEGGDEADSLLFARDSLYTASDRTREVIGVGIESYVLRPMLRPMERQLERWTGDFSHWLRMKNMLRLDMVRLQPGFARNVFDQDLGAVDRLRGSQFTLGKSLYDNMFFTYTGTLDTLTAADGTSPGLGLTEHRLGLQLKVLQNLRVDYEYRIETEEPKNKQDVRLKYYFYFE